MKKILKWMLMLVMILGLTACGSSKSPEEPDDATVKKDVQEYLIEIVDEKAEVDIFEKTGSDKDGDKLTVNCNVLYSIEGENHQGEFILSYTFAGNEWELFKCRINSKEDSGDDDKTEEEKKEEAETTEKEETDNNVSSKVEMSDELYDFTFILDGVVYQLPFAYTELTTNGWTISSSGTSESTVINANSHDSFYMAKNGSKVVVDVINLSGNNKVLKDCKVGGILVENDDLTDKSIFSMAKGINVDSTYDEIVAAYGSGDQTNEYDDHIKLTYIKDNDIGVAFYCYSENKEYNEIMIQNNVSDENDKTETLTEVPEYLSTYKAPSELGADLASGIVQIESKLYSLPAPVSLFLEDGWEITSKPASVGAGNYDSLTLKKNDKKMDVQIMNYGDYQTTPENCAVYSLYFYEENDIDVVMPGNISWSSSRSDVEEVISEDFSYDKGNSYRYTYDKDEKYVSVSVDLRSEKVNIMYMKVQHWDYE